MEQASRGWRWAIAIVLGTLTCVYAFGLDYIIGRGAFWDNPVGDAQTQLVGFRYFVEDSWHLPLLKTVMIAPPRGTNILLLDSLPIVALPVKLLAPVLGNGFNGFGWWMLAAYILQAWFAMRLVAALGAPGRWTAVIAAIVALTFHAFLARFYHLALDGHFVVLWSLCLYFERPAEGPRGAFERAWVAQLVVALLVHPYLLAMSLAIFGAALVRGITRAQIVRRLFAAAAVIVALAAVAALTGHASRSMRKGAAACCYGDSSLNLASLVVPNPGRSHLWADTPAYRLDQTGLQWDGSMFLGFGVLLLVGASLVLAPREVGRALRRHVALAVALLGLVVFALSNRAFFLDHTLWRIDVPGPLQSIAGTFRASGRFAWPFGYMVALGALAFVARLPRPRIAMAVTGLAAVIGIVDAFPTLHVVQTNTRVGEAWRLDRSALASAIAVHGRIEMFPTYACSHVLRALVDLESREIQLLGARAGVPINGTRIARTTTSCRAERKSWSPYDTRPGVLSVYVRATSPHERPPWCRPYGPWILCSDAWAATGMNALRAATDANAPTTYQPGDSIPMLRAAGTRFLDGGWQAGLTWDELFIDARGGHVRLHLAQPGRFRLEVHPTPGSPAATRLVATHDGLPLLDAPIAPGPVVSPPVALAGDVELVLSATGPEPLGIQSIALVPIGDTLDAHPR